MFWVVIIVALIIGVLVASGIAYTLWSLLVAVVKAIFAFIGGMTEALLILAVIVLGVWLANKLRNHFRSHY